MLELEESSTKMRKKTATLGLDLAWCGRKCRRLSSGVDGVRDSQSCCLARPLMGMVGGGSDGRREWAVELSAGAEEEGGNVM